MKCCNWFLMFTLLAGMSMATLARADSWLPQIGGKGGAQYGERCPQGQILTGFELRAGDDIDAIRAVCVTPSSPTQISAPPLSNGFGGGWHGGGGGGLQRLLCPPGTPVVGAVVAGYDGIDTVSLDTIDIFCQAADASGAIGQYPSNQFHAPIQGCTQVSFGHYDLLIDLVATRPSNHCPNFQVQREGCPAGEIGVGMHGRSGALVDAMGLICGPAPTFAPSQPVITTVIHADTRTRVERAADNVESVDIPPATAAAIKNAGATAKPRGTAADMHVSKTPAPAAERSIIIVGGKPKPKAKAKQPTVLDRLDGDRKPD